MKATALRVDLKQQDAAVFIYFLPISYSKKRKKLEDRLESLLYHYVILSKKPNLPTPVLKVTHNNVCENFT